MPFVVSVSARVTRVGEPRSNKSVQAIPPPYSGTYVSNYRAYIDSAPLADLFMDGNQDREWDTRS